MDGKYSIWIDSEHEATTLVPGTEPLKFGNGDVDPECDKCLHTFIAGSFALASEYYNDWLLKNIGIFPK